MGTVSETSSMRCHSTLRSVSDCAQGAVLIIHCLIMQEQPSLTGQQASLLSWFTAKLADVASEQQLHAQKSLPALQPMHERVRICSSNLQYVQRMQ